ncbi:MAG: menaquinone biosynthetic enzyme MqnA/MqnD family protein [Desulfococcaceae bacterium]
MKLSFDRGFPCNVRVGRISYMNVAPVYYGLNNGHKPRWMDMVCAPPSVLNTMLAAGELDISPVSSAAYARHQKEWLLLPDLSISCFGKVMSVLLVSRCSFKELDKKTVVLTRDSAAAAALSRYLFASQRICPQFKTGKVLCPDDLPHEAGAALVIGDAALKEDWAAHFAHVWDLGEMWLERTRMPFVFALWAVRRQFAEENPESVSAVTEEFRRSKLLGKQNIKRILPLASEKLGISTDTCDHYYQRLHYDLSPMQIRGLERFFNGLYREGIISKPVNLSFFHEEQTFSRSHAA